MENGQKALVAIAAMQPLIDGRPNPEFSLRLDKGYQLFCQLQREGYAVSVYVGGDRLRQGDVTDPMALGHAGAQYLHELGVPSGDIFEADANLKYIDHLVVSSADECWVASQLYVDGGYHKLAAVAATGQSWRVRLNYAAMGVPAEIHVVPVVGSLGLRLSRYALEAALYFYTLVDRTWQGRFSLMEKIALKTRSPKQSLPDRGRTP